MESSVEDEAARAALQPAITEFCNAMSDGMKEMGQVKVPKRKEKKVLTEDQLADKQLTKIFKTSWAQIIYRGGYTWAWGRIRTCTHKWPDLCPEDAQICYRERARTSLPWISNAFGRFHSLGEGPWAKAVVLGGGV